MPRFDLSETPVRALNAALHESSANDDDKLWQITNPRGKHAIAAGIDAPLSVEINGHVGYYCAGMNKHAAIRIRGNAGVGLAENMMSGRVHLEGDASQSAGATGRGGLLVIDGNASARCGISMKGIDILVKGGVGPMSAFMAQAGNLVVLGDAGQNLGDSIYEARIFVQGAVKSLGADCIEKEPTGDDRAALKDILAQAGVLDQVNPAAFRLYGSSRRLYHFHISNVDAY